jgi:hypothetical protein
MLNSDESTSGCCGIDAETGFPVLDDRCVRFDVIPSSPKVSAESALPNENRHKNEHLAAFKKVPKNLNWRNVI